MQSHLTLNGSLSIRSFNSERNNNKVVAGVDAAGIPNAKSVMLGVNLSF